jgi:hypothetical protein
MKAELRATNEVQNDLIGTFVVSTILSSKILKGVSWGFRQLVAEPLANARLARMSPASDNCSFWAKALAYLDSPKTIVRLPLRMASGAGTLAVGWYSSLFSLSLVENMLGQLKENVFSVWQDGEEASRFRGAIDEFRNSKDKNASGAEKLAGAAQEYNQYLTGRREAALATFFKREMSLENLSEDAYKNAVEAAETDFVNELNVVTPPETETLFRTIFADLMKKNATSLAKLLSDYPAEPPHNPGLVLLYALGTLEMNHAQNANDRELLMALASNYYESHLSIEEKGT